MSRSSYPPWLDHPNNIRWKVQAMKLIMQFSPTTCHFLPVSSKYSSSQSPSIYAFPLMWYSKFHTQTKQKVKLWFLYILMVLEWRREDGIFRAEWQPAFCQFNIFLVCSWTQFLYVTIVPKYLNFVTFSKDLLSIIKLLFYPAYYWWDIPEY
jgi:hypothetical protein